MGKNKIKRKTSLIDQNRLKTKYNIMLFIALALFLTITIVICPVLAITVNPNSYSLKEAVVEKNYKIVVTVNNNDAQIFSIRPEIDPYSYYAKDIIKITPEIITLNPLDKENINIEFKIPKDFPIGKHKIKINLNSIGKTLSSFVLDIDIPGEAITSAELNSIIINANTPQQPIYITLNIKNTGNTIITPTPIIELYKYSIPKETKPIAILGEQSKITIMPSKDYNLSLMYDPASLDEGTYSAIGYLKYEDKKTDPIEERFKLTNLNSTVKEYSKIIKIKKGNDAEIELKVKNNEDKRSFYQIAYKIEQNNTYDSIQGELLPNEPKIVTLKMNTSSLNDGEYETKIIIRKGNNLEYKEENTVKIIITENNNLLFLIILISLTVIIIGIIALFVVLNKSNSSSGDIDDDNTKKSIISSYKYDRKTKKLEKEIKKTKNKYDKIEEDYRYVGNRIHDFVTKSNTWLEKEGYNNRFN